MKDIKKHGSKKNYLEYFAKLLLEYIFFDRYGVLVQSDKPDLRSLKGNNVEVTQAMYPNEGDMLGISKKILNCNVDEVGESWKETANRKGYRLLEYNGKYFGYGLKEAVWGTSQFLKKATKSKINKLPTYGNTVDLFLYAPDIYDNQDDSDLKDYEEWCKNEFSETELIFHHIYVFDSVSLYDFDFDNDSLTCIPIERNVVKDFVDKAKSYAELNT